MVVSFEERPFSDVDESKSIDAILSQHHSTGFNADGLPLWRVVVFEKNATQSTPTIHLSFILHHVIGNGRSGLAVLSTILQALNSDFCQSQGVKPDSTSNYACKVVVSTPSQPLQPALEEILSMPMTTMTKISHVLGPWVPSWLNNIPALGKWSGRPYHRKEPIKTRIRQLKISSETTQD